MAQDDGIKKAADAIAESKKVLDTASALQKAAGGPMDKPKPAVATKPAAKKAPSSGLLGEAESAAAGLNAKAANIKEYTDAQAKSAPKMHKGGEVMEDGIKNLQKGEVVIPKEKADEGKKIMGLKKKAKGAMGDAIEEEKAEKETPAEEKKEGKKGEDKEKKSESKKDSKKVKKAKGIHIRHGASGGFIAKHDVEMGEDGKMGEPQEHVLPSKEDLMAHVDQHMGDGMPEGEPEQGSPEGGAPQQ